MTMAALSLVVTAAYVALASSDQELACNVAPAYLALIVAVWWIGRRKQQDRNTRA